MRAAATIRCEAARIHGPQPIRGHAHLHRHPSGERAKVPVDQSVDERLAERRLRILPEVLVEEPPHDRAPLRVPLQRIQHRLEQAGDGAVEPSQVQEALPAGPRLAQVRIRRAWPPRGPDRPGTPVDSGSVPQVGRAHSLGSGGFVAVSELSHQRRHDEADNEGQPWYERMPSLGRSRGPHRSAAATLAHAFTACLRATPSTAGRTL